MYPNGDESFAPEEEEFDSQSWPDFEVSPTPELTNRNPEPTNPGPNPPFPPPPMPTNFFHVPFAHIDQARAMVPHLRNPNHAYVAVPITFINSIRNDRRRQSVFGYLIYPDH